VPRSFDIFAFVDHLRRRVGFLVVTCAITACLSLGVSMALPRRYTATARILIDPPAGSDQRMAINPVYLESLKTYEMLALSDHLLLDSLQQFHIRSEKPVSELKRSILRVNIPRSTRILEIAVTLPDPRKAQFLALHLAQRTIDLSRLSAAETERDLITNAQTGLEDAKNRFETAEQVWAGLASDSLSRSAAHSVRVNVAEENREAARNSFELAQRRVQEVRLGTGYRGERLSIIDPGIVPDSYSSPNIFLNVLMAVLVAATACLFYIAWGFNYRIHRGFTVADPLTANRGAPTKLGRP